MALKGENGNLLENVPGGGISTPTNYTKDYSFSVTFNGTSGLGAIGGVTIPSLLIKNGWFIEEAFIEVVTTLVGSTSYLSLGFTGNNNIVLNSVNGLISTLNSNINTKVVLENFTLSNNNTNALILNVNTANITSGSIKILIRATNYDIAISGDGLVLASGGSLLLTTSGTSGAATLVGATLNIPNYAGGGGTVSRFGIEDNLGVQSRSVDMGSYSLNINTLSVGNTPLLVTSLNGGSGIVSTATGSNGSVGVGGNTDIGIGVEGYASGLGFGISSYTNGEGIPLKLTNISSTTNTVIPMAQIRRETIGVAANGIGASLDFSLEKNDGIISSSNKLISKFTVVNPGTQTSQFQISGYNNAVEHLLTFPSLTADQYSPLSVNGNFADAAGNITISGSGSASRFGIEDNLGVQNRVVDMQTFSFNLSGNMNSSVLQINNNGAGHALVAFSNGNAVFFQSSTNLGLDVNTNNLSGIGAGQFTVGQADLNVNTVLQNIIVRRAVSGIPAPGIGSSIDFDTRTVSGAAFSNRLISKWTNPTDASKTSQFQISGYNNAIQHYLTFPSLTSDQFSPLSVNGNFADAAGNITISGGGGGSYTASNGLTLVSSDFRLGGSLTANTTITSSPYSFTVSGSSVNGGIEVLKISDIGNGFGIFVNANTGIGIGVTTTTGFAALFQSTSASSAIVVNSFGGTGAVISSFSTYGAVISRSSAVNNVINNVISINSNALSPTSGFGSSIDFILSTSTVGGDVVSNQLISKWTNVIFASRTSEFSITGVNNAVISTLFTLAGSGSTKLNKYGIGTFTGTAAYNLAVDSSGNIIETTSAGISYLGKVNISEGDTIVPASAGNIVAVTNSPILSRNILDLTMLTPGNGAVLNVFIIGTIISLSATGATVLGLPNMVSNKVLNLIWNASNSTWYCDGQNERPYRSYSALLNITGSGSFSITVLENTIGSVPTWTRTAIGNFQGDFPFLPGTGGAPLTIGKTMFIIFKTSSEGINYYIRSSANNSATTVNFFQANSSNIYTDTLINQQVEIRVYN